MLYAYSICASDCEICLLRRPPVPADRRTAPLYLRVLPHSYRGGRLRRFKYRGGGVEKLLTLGAYPDVSLKRAREKRMTLGVRWRTASTPVQNVAQSPMPKPTPF
jgi:Arm DNA-binding domain